VQDLVDAYLLAAEKPQAIGQLYIVAGRNPVLLEDVFATIAQLAKVAPLPIRIPAWPIQLAGSIVEALCRPFGIEPPLHRRRCDFFVKNRWFDTRKIQTELGFSPRHDFAHEASIIFNWYKEHGWLE
jgi:nucleoside-diphosphate-sugar epimerase